MRSMTVDVGERLHAIKGSLDSSEVPHSSLKFLKYVLSALSVIKPPFVKSSGNQKHFHAVEQGFHGQQQAHISA